MHPARLISVAALSLVSVGCDDTSKAIKEEVKEIDGQEVKRDLKAAASTLSSAAVKLGQKVDEAAPKVVDSVKSAAKETEKVIDKVDKKAAEEIRRDRRVP
jgi:phage-related minor tail protein